MYREDCHEKSKRHFEPTPYDATSRLLFTAVLKGETFGHPSSALSQSTINRGRHGTISEYRSLGICETIYMPTRAQSRDQGTLHQVRFWFSSCRYPHSSWWVSNAGDKFREGQNVVGLAPSSPPEIDRSLAVVEMNGRIYYNENGV